MIYVWANFDEVLNFHLLSALHERPRGEWDGSSTRYYRDRWLLPVYNKSKDASVQELLFRKTDHRNQYCFSNKPSHRLELLHVRCMRRQHSAIELRYINLL